MQLIFSINKPGSLSFNFLLTRIKVQNLIMIQTTESMWVADFRYIIPENLYKN